MTTNTCDWTLVISALAIGLPGLIAAVVVWIKADAEFKYSKSRQHLMLDGLQEVKSSVVEVKQEQAAVKEALNGNGNGNADH